MFILKLNAELEQTTLVKHHKTYCKYKFSYVKEYHFKIY